MNNYPINEQDRPTADASRKRPGHVFFTKFASYRNQQEGREANIFLDGYRIGLVERLVDAENVALRGGNSHYVYRVSGYRITVFDPKGGTDDVEHTVPPGAWKDAARAWILRQTGRV